MNKLLGNILAIGKQISIALKEGNTQEMLLNRNKLFLLLNELCEYYLKGDEVTRNNIREFFHGLKGDSCYVISGNLYQYINMLASTFDIEHAEDFLNKGLVAAAIEDASLDFRDLLVSLGELYLAAQRKGISPEPYFQKIAVIANQNPNIEKFSTQELLAGFSKSDYLRSILKQ